MQLRELSNEALLKSTHTVVQREREILRDVLLHLLEVERRMLFIQMDYKSLFDFCMKELGYSEGSAQLRIDSMRLIRDVPDNNKNEVIQKLESGTLNITQLSLVQKFSRTVKQEQGRQVEGLEKLALLEKIENKTTKETVKIAIQIFKIPKPKGEELKIYFDEETLILFQEFKALTSHSNPGGKDSVALELALKMALQVLKKKKLGNPTASHAVINAKQSTLPKATERHVWRTNEARCSHVDSKTNQRCTSQHFLQIHHVKHKQDGGDHRPENLTLLCHAHHKWEHMRK